MECWDHRDKVGELRELGSGWAGRGGRSGQGVLLWVSDNSLVRQEEIRHFPDIWNKPHIPNYLLLL